LQNRRLSAIRRCIEFGVRSIEHGTLIDDDTARFAAEGGADTLDCKAKATLQ